MIHPPGVLAAARRLNGVARRTPLEEAPALSRLAGRTVLLKLENQQRTGSFKFRGAYAALSNDRAAFARGVVTASAGNHGLGTALAGRLLDVPVTVYAPDDTPAVKLARIQALGATLVPVAGGYDQAHAEAEDDARTRHLPYLHAFSDPDVVAGQGTVGLEILEDCPEPGAVIAPVGGGGLIGGVGTMVRALSPNTRVVGVQTTETAAMACSLREGRVVSPPMGETLCEGLSGDVDERSLALATRVVDEMLVVEEGRIAPAIRRLYEAEAVLAEGSAGVVAAALFDGLLDALPEPLILIVSGGNIDAARISTLFSE
jgi:threonine dehydratase